MRDVILVSSEMTAFVGRGPVDISVPLPDSAIVFAFSGFDCGETPRISLGLHLDPALAESPLVFAVARAACLRLFPDGPEKAGTWYMTSALRDLALTIVTVEGPREMHETLRLARSIELLCQVQTAYTAGALLAAEGACPLNEFDRARIAAARLAIEDGWSGKLTIPELAQRCGLNRDKLVRGFRQLYGATIAEVLSERRLGAARQLLLASDLPVASVGYRCGYLNNASFARAFARRFGVPPSELRRGGLAA